MRKYRIMILGFVVLIVSILVGILGVYFGLGSSFGSMKSAETAGITTVSKGIFSSMISLFFLIIGSILGLTLIVVGGIKANKDSKDGE